MQLIVKPHDDSLEALLSANTYRQLWHEHKKAIVSSFQEITGLTFQQHTITAHVFLDSDASAGKWRDPMHLPAYASDDKKLLILIHELCHRLLGGNALSPIGLGLLPDVPELAPDALFQEYEHQHTYLFEYDVVRQALGNNYAEKCRQMNESDANMDGPHDRAWAWAMNMDFEARQRALRHLAAEALTREHWVDRDDSPVEAGDPEAWFNLLASK